MAAPQPSPRLGEPLPRTLGRVVAAALITYAVLALGAAAGLIIGYGVPCAGEAWSCLGRLVVGGPALGALVALVPLAIAAHLLGLRWWFTPVLLALLVGGLVVFDQLGAEDLPVPFWLATPWLAAASAVRWGRPSAGPER